MGQTPEMEDSNFVDGLCYLELLKAGQFDGLCASYVVDHLGFYPKFSDFAKQFAWSAGFCKPILPKLRVVKRGFLHVSWKYGSTSWDAMLDYVERNKLHNYYLGGINNGLVVDTVDPTAINELLHLGGYDPSQVLKDYLVEEIRKPDSSVKKAVAEAVLATSQNRVAIKKLTRVNLNIKLDSVQMTLLNDAFPEIDINYANFGSHRHDLAAAARKCEEVLFLLKLSYNDSQAVPVGYDCAIKDIGGNVRTHLERRRFNVHSCCPVLDAIDGQRESTTLTYLQNRRPQFRSILGNRKVRKYIMCQDKAQECKVKAPSALFIHSMYNMTPIDIADAMDSGCVIEAYGSLIFDPMMLIDDEGLHMPLNVRWVIKYKGTKKDRIRFNFLNDMSHGYDHDYATYISLMTVSAIRSSRGNLYFFEHCDYRLGTVHIHVVRNMSKEIPRSIVYHTITVPKMVDKKIVHYYQYTCRTGTPVIVKKQIRMHKSLLDRGLSQALSLSTQKFSVNSIYDFLRSANSRIIVNGVDVMTPEPLEAEDLFTLAHALYVYTFIMRYQHSQLVSIITERIKKERKLRDLSFLPRLWEKLFGDEVPKIEEDFPKDGKSMAGIIAAWTAIPEAFPVTIENAVTFKDCETVISQTINDYVDPLFKDRYINCARVNTQIMHKPTIDAQINSNKLLSKALGITDSVENQSNDSETEDSGSSDTDDVSSDVDDGGDVEKSKVVPEHVLSTDEDVCKTDVSINETLKTLPDVPTHDIDITNNNNTVSDVSKPTDKPNLKQQISISVSETIKIPIKEKQIVAPLYEIYHNSQYKIVKEVQGDGNCFFHSIIHLLDLNSDVKKIKTTLLNSKYLKDVEEKHNVTDILSSNNKWADSNVIWLTAQHYNVAIVVHQVFSSDNIQTIIFNSSCSSIVHVELKDQHFSPVIPIVTDEIRSRSRSRSITKSIVSPSRKFSKDTTDSDQDLNKINISTERWSRKDCVLRKPKTLMIRSKSLETTVHIPPVSFLKPIVGDIISARQPTIVNTQTFPQPTIKISEISKVSDISTCIDSIPDNLRSQVMIPKYCHKYLNGNETYSLPNINAPLDFSFLTSFLFSAGLSMPVNMLCKIIDTSPFKNFPSDSKDIQTYKDSNISAQLVNLLAHQFRTAIVIHDKDEKKVFSPEFVNRKTCHVGYKSNKFTPLSVIKKTYSSVLNGVTDLAGKIKNVSKTISEQTNKIVKSTSADISRHYNDVSKHTIRAAKIINNRSKEISEKNKKLSKIVAKHTRNVTLRNLERVTRIPECDQGPVPLISYVKPKTLVRSTRHLIRPDQKRECSRRNKSYYEILSDLSEDDTGLDTPVNTKPKISKRNKTQSKIKNKKELRTRTKTTTADKVKILQNKIDDCLEQTNPASIDLGEISDYSSDGGDIDIEQVQIKENPETKSIADLISTVDNKQTLFTQFLAKNDLHIVLNDLIQPKTRDYFLEIYNYIHDNNLKEHSLTSNLYRIKKFINRSAYKLLEIAHHGFEISEPVLDLCGSPGGFLQTLSYLGYSDVTSISVDDKYRRDKFSEHYKVSIQDVFTYNTEQKYSTLLADGAVEDSYSDSSIFDREVEIVLKALIDGGNACIKHNNYFCMNLNALHGYFETVEVFKPVLSCEGNSECYILCKGFSSQCKHKTEVIDEERDKFIKGINQYFNPKPVLSYQQLKHFIDTLVVSRYRETGSLNDVQFVSFAHEITPLLVKCTSKEVTGNKFTIEYGVRPGFKSFRNNLVKYTIRSDLAKLDIEAIINELNFDLPHSTIFNIDVDLMDNIGCDNVYYFFQCLNTIPEPAFRFRLNSNKKSWCPIISRFSVPKAKISYSSMSAYETWSKSGDDFKQFNPRRRQTHDPILIMRNAMDEQREYWRVKKTILLQQYRSKYTQIFSTSKTLTSLQRRELTIGSEGYGVMRYDGTFEIKPTFPRKYDFAFDGKDFVPIVDNIPQVDHKNLLLVGNSLELMQDGNLFESVKDVDVDKFLGVVIENRQGVPGCGKTYNFLQTCIPPSDTVMGDLVLFPTREGCIEFRKRIKQKYPDISPKYLTRNYRTMDSFLINCYNENYDRVMIDEALMVHAGQLLFCVVRASAKKLIMIGDNMQIKFINRTPQCKIMFSDPALFTSPSVHLSVSYRCTLSVARVLSKHYEQGMKAVSKVTGEMSLQKFKNITAIPTSKTAQYLVFKQSEKLELIKAGYTNTLTIHEYQGKQAADVIVVRTTTKKEDIYNYISHALVAISRHTKSFIYISPVSDDAISKYVNESKDFNFSNSKDYYHSISGGATITYAIMTEDHETPLIDHPNVYSCGRKFGYPLVHPIRPKILLTEIVPYCDKPYLSVHIDTPDSNVLQEFYDHVLPGNSLHIMKYDPQFVDHSSMNLTLENTIFNPYFKSTTVKMVQFDKMRPSLRTACPTSRPSNQIESVLAMIKRNQAVPDLAGVRDDDVLSDLMLKKFVSSYLKPGVTSSTFSEMPITINEYDICRWLKTQPTSTIDRIEQENHLSERSLTNYQFMIKSTVKPQLDCNAPYVYSALQTIAYQGKEINVIFCPIFTNIRDRVLMLLQDRFMINTDMSPDEMCQTLHQRFGSELLNKYHRFLEVDMSKYDKSQGRVMLMFETKLMRYFAVDEELIQLWWVSHENTTLSDRLNKVKSFVSYQRKSGDASTFIGNTFFLMAVLACLFDMDSVKFGIFAGDDSLIVGGEEINKDLNQMCAALFNLESKFLRNYKYPYFCSKFLVPDGDGYSLIPDPVKLITKLGRSDLTNPEHVEQYRVSLQDIVKPYRNICLHEVLSLAVNERYLSSGNHSNTFSHLFAIVHDKEEFHKLFFSLPEDNMCYDPSLKGFD
nr:MAG: RNA-dependent RNA polymerase [Virgaviridae-like virus 1]